MHDPATVAYYAAIDLVLHFPGTSKAPSGIDPSLGESIRASGGLVAFSDSTWCRPDRHGFNMFGFVVFFMEAPISITSNN